VRPTRPLALAAAGALVLTACSGGGQSVDTGGGGGDSGNVLVAAVSAQPDQFGTPAINSGDGATPRR
jgi:peptide/nickel transport system substrate-binding protein